MSPEIAVVARPLTAQDLAPGLGNLDRLAELVRRSKADNTWRCYRSAWGSFTAWCKSHGHVSLPTTPSVVASYLGEVSQRLRASSLEVHVSSIAAIHKLAGHASPTVHPLIEQVMAGIRREDRRSKKKAKGLSLANLVSVVEALPASTSGLRSRAVLTVGWWGSLRRSEIVGLDVRDLDFGVRGVAVSIRRSKTDQENKGSRLALPRTNDTVCPATALREWIEATGIEGALFRPVDRHGRLRATRLTSQSVAHIVKRACAAVGLDPAVVSGHSLRRGMITAAVEAGIPEHVVAKHSRHKSAAIKEYIEAGELWTHSAAVRLARTGTPGSERGRADDAPPPETAVQGHGEDGHDPRVTGKVTTPPHPERGGPR